jgi:ribosome-associated protein YbcJ (S4-like RNA binding protein)
VVFVEDFKLNRAFITLGQLLQASGRVDSGAQAKLLVKKQRILVNGQPEDRRGRKLYAQDEIEIAGEKILIK